MQNLLSMIQPASTVDAGNLAVHASANAEPLSELFGEWLQKFQAIRLGIEGESEDGTVVESTQVVEEATEASLDLETQNAVLEVQQRVLERLAELDLPDSVDAETLLSIVTEVLGRGKHPTAGVPLSDSSAQERLPEIIAKEGAFPVPGHRAAVTTPVMEALVASLRPEVAEPATKGIPTEAHLESRPGLAKVPAQGIDSQGLAHGSPTPIRGLATQVVPTTEGAEEGVKPPEALPVRSHVEPQVPRAEVLLQRPDHPLESSVERVSRSMASQVLAQLKESGVKGIDEAKVARVEAATLKSLAPDATVAVVPINKPEAIAFTPPKVAPLLPEGDAVESVVKVTTPVVSVPDEEGNPLLKDLFVQAKGPIAKEEVVLTENGKVNVVPVVADASSEAVSFAKPTIDAPVANVIPLHASKIEGLEAPVTPQKVPLEAEVPTVRNAGDFTIRSVRHLLGSGEESIEVRLNPRSLGALNIAVKTMGGSVEILVTAASPMVREMLEVHLLGLKESLMNEGVEVTKVRVESPGVSQSDMTHLSSQQHANSSQNDTRQSQSTQGASARYDGEESEFDEQTSDETKPSLQHEGDLNLYA